MLVCNWDIGELVNQSELFFFNLKRLYLNVSMSFFLRRFGFWLRIMKILKGIEKCVATRI